jgi:phosphate transport system permease protein
MTAFIVQVSMGDTPQGTLEYKSIYVVGAALFVMTFVMNWVSYKLSRRYRRLT